MRLWIEQNLQINLERKFRCVHPKDLVPNWLADAGLRVSGSTITTVRFLAIPPPRGVSAAFSTATMTKIIGEASPESASASGADDGTGSSASSVNSAKMADYQVRAELRSVVGRMLWKEVWGKYVSGNKWWWEDPLCVKECQELGTHWVYQVVVGLKGAAGPQK
jgi:hypothetical protein